MKIWKRKHNTESTEELLIDESFITWLEEGKPEANLWHFRMGELHSRKAMEQAEEIIGLLKKQAVDSHSDYERINKIKAGIDRGVSAISTLDQFNDRRATPINWFDRYGKWIVAACAALLLVSMILVYDYSGTSSSHQTESHISQLEEIKSTKDGQKLTVHLSDGSRVRLNSGSKISYSKYFTGTSRDIYLEGEAYFEVMKDADRPFRVHTSSSITQALGTSFNVKSMDDTESEIILLTGKVLVESLTDHSKVMLVPGNLIKVDDEGTGDIQQAKYKDFSWKDDILIFDGSNREEVFDMLRKWYGVDFDIRGNVKTDEWSYSAKFENQSLVRVLETISYAEGFSFSIENDKITINLNSL